MKSRVTVLKLVISGLALPAAPPLRLGLLGLGLAREKRRQKSNWRRARAWVAGEVNGLGAEKPV
jgi:hypothetical protein